MLTIRSNRDVYFYTVVITVLATLASGGVVYYSMTTFLPFARPFLRFAMTLAIAIPILIAVPVSYLALRMMKMIQEGVDKLENFVKYDPLTGVLTRVYMLESFRIRFGEGGVLFLVDADHFKRINDTYGHDVGDEALRTIGAALNMATPDDSMIGRIGGEEFAIFFPGMRTDEIPARAEAIKSMIAKNGKIISEREIGLTVSIGVAEIQKGSTLTVVFKEADENLYVAKRSGRNRYVMSKSEPDLQLAELKSA
ncbi:MAG: GGDEF domain-containing protein [Rhodobiaceae bacterium]|nr:GGDEF domain-containing protein [Rhodobiaceae bacterium]